jgi:hypothetical protein
MLIATALLHGVCIQAPDSDHNCRYRSDEGLLCTTSCDKSTNPMQKREIHDRRNCCEEEMLIATALLHGVC